MGSEAAEPRSFRPRRPAGLRLLLPRLRVHGQREAQESRGKKKIVSQCVVNSVILTVVLIGATLRSISQQVLS